MTNAETTNSAAFADNRVELAPAPLFPVSWYSLNSANGEPEGSEEAASYEEAAAQWGEHLSNGDTRLLEVWGPQGNRWFKVERELHGVRAVECSS